MGTRLKKTDSFCFFVRWNARRFVGWMTGGGNGDGGDDDDGDDDEDSDVAALTHPTTACPLLTGEWIMDVMLPEAI